MKTIITIILVALVTTQVGRSVSLSRSNLSYPIVDTAQQRCYNNTREISPAAPGRDFYGQDAQYDGRAPAYRDNGDGTITDLNTGLTWQQNPGEKVTHDQAVSGAASCRTGGCTDWRLPNAKELQSIVDYSRSPDATRSAAIDPLFQTSPITNEAGQPDFPWYWTSTTHASANGRGNAAAYIAFGRALGFMRGQWIDVHGTGSQRSYPKTGNPENYPRGRGPQGDAIRILNYVRCVRGSTAK